MIKTFNKSAIEKNVIKEYVTLKLLIAITEVTVEVLRLFNKLICEEKFIKEYNISKGNNK
ncbi:MAG: hypothetical protein RBT59_12245 [Arcobacteraceae bacterium]|jgi:hypothetical protein|nr:hypothetical protein [Arcobacteraceae bacterium]